MLFQGEPHFLLLSSTTHMNLHLCKMIQNMDYKTSHTFEQYMKKNVNHKLVPIQEERTGTSPQRKLYLHSYYTTAQSVARIP